MGKPEDRDPDRWDMKTELLARLVEVTSVAATEKNRLRKPIEIPRPWAKATGDGKAGVRVLQTTQQRVKVVKSSTTAPPPLRRRLPNGQLAEIGAA